MEDKKIEHKKIKRGNLLSEEFVGTIYKDDINRYFPERKKLEGNIDDLPTYDIDLYKIRYASIYGESVAELSGLVLVPKKEGNLTHLQYHHGTLLPFPAKYGWGSGDAPSLYKGNKVTNYKEHYETRLNGNYLASYGYLLSLPDYAGYGLSENLEHPYSISVELAKESVDMILATREFAENKNIILNEGMFLSGWSEGGAVSVATQRLIESEYENKIKLIGVSSMSAMLNTSANMGKIFLEAPYVSMDIGEAMDLISWMYYTYNKFSDNPLAFDKIFKIPVCNDLDVLKNRKTNIPSEVFKILEESSYLEMMKMAKENNLAEAWAPLAPLFIHHGTADSIVPYENNPELAVKNYIAKGGNAKLISYNGHEHSTLGLLQLKNMIEDFETLEASF